MPIEPGAERIGDLNPLWPRDSDILSEGASHIRMIKAILRGMNEARIGEMIVWTKGVSTIPPGFAVADGTKGTVDMRGRVPIGVSSAYAFNSIGGQATVQLTEANLPAHSHSLSSNGGHTHSSSMATEGNHRHTSTTSSESNHTHSGTTAYDGIHNHSASSGSAGSHNHSGTTAYDGSHNHSGTTATDGLHSHSYTLNRAYDAVGLNDVHYIGRGGDSSTRTGRSGKINSNGKHNHSFTTSTIGNHRHSFTTSTQSNHRHSVSVSNSSSHRHSFGTSAAGGHNHTLTTTYAGGHTHGLTINSVSNHSHTVGDTGSGTQHNNLQPYRALFWIQRIAV